ncbi:VQ motif-containing protein 4-like [Zingiber officinale]|nr:VQ motif-containing protein 4-like [Zingiber officinale]
MEKEIRSPNSSPSSSSSSNNGVSSSPAPAPMVTPKSTPRSADAANPYPTTFIQADAGSFKQVVQMLTGSSDGKQPPLPRPAKNGISSAVKATGPKKPAFKLYERRGSLKNLKMMSPMIPSCWNRDSPLGGSAGSSPRRQPTEILSPSVLDLPSLTLSPISPLNTDSFHRSLPPNPPSALAMSAEERAIAEKGFYLHPSPRTTPRDAEPPMLLQLFPVTSPRVPSASVAGSSS